MNTSSDTYTLISPGDLWKIYSSVHGIFRGGGSDSSPKLTGANGPRARDFDIVYDATEKCEIALPDQTKGLSFSSTIDRLRKIPIPGRVWVLPKGSQLPEGLMFSYRTQDHPLLTVSRRVTVLDLLSKLSAVADLLRLTDTRIHERKA